MCSQTPRRPAVYATNPIPRSIVQQMARPLFSSLAVTCLAPTVCLSGWDVTLVVRFVGNRWSAWMMYVRTSSSRCSTIIARTIENLQYSRHHHLGLLHLDRFFLPLIVTRCNCMPSTRKHTISTATHLAPARTTLERCIHMIEDASIYVAATRIKLFLKRTYG